MQKKHDILIIGADVIGCSIAYHLAKKGVSSCIIESALVLWTQDYHQAAILVKEVCRYSRGLK
jgi:glycine/D-amino acid oxidase-like deaminating enzyme